MVRALAEPMSLLLLAAAAVSGIGLHERLNGLAILAIVLLNAVIGLLQEGKAERALDSLRRMESPSARVVRGGRTLSVPARDLVPGDVVVLVAGDRIPADLHWSRAASLEVDESLLTGESLPVAKDPAAQEVPDAPLGDRPATGFSGTVVTRGNGRGVVVATGLRTQLGAVFEGMRAPNPPTPLQVELRHLTTRLGTVAVAISVAVFALTLARLGVSGHGLQRAFLSAVALAVAAVPEGMATVVTVALALGVRRMAARGAIIRRLVAVETLGSTTVIATDKTGTLTENRLAVEGFAIVGDDRLQPLDSLPVATRGLVERVAALCNDADPDIPGADPTDAALMGAIDAATVSALRREHPRLAEAPFDSERKRMSTLHGGAGALMLLVKGAPEVVLTRSADALRPDGSTSPLGPAERGALEQALERMAGRGVRMLALAGRSLPGPVADIAAEERDLTFFALAGLRDPVRSEAAGAVARARGAGVRIIMVTGDHAGTAEAVAEEVRLVEPGSRAVTGPALRANGLPPDPLATPVYARVDPDQKLGLVEALRDCDEIVAVTGDGVNDAPAMRAADIGVAMGQSGSDVARQASDMIVTDDDLSTIVEAIQEGRGVYDNIRKVVDYLVAGNLSEISVVVGALLLFPSVGVPLLPLQLLWINLLTDGLPALALGVDPVDPDLMSRPPRPRSHRLLSGRRAGMLFGRGLLIAASALGSLAVARYAFHQPWAHARASMFTVLVGAHLLYAFAARLPCRGLLTNRWLLGAIASGVALQSLIVALPAAHGLFGTAPLSIREWVTVAVGSVAPVTLMLSLRRRGRSSPATGGSSPRPRAARMRVRT